MQVTVQGCLARITAMVLLVGLLGSPAAASADTATVFYYKKTAVAQTTEGYGGRLRWNISNHMRVVTCPNGCGTNVYEISHTTGKVRYRVYHDGAGSFGIDHPRLYTRTYCQVHYAWDWPKINCHQLYYA
jgi:hypothetical protein